MLQRFPCRSASHICFASEIGTDAYERLHDEYEYLTKVYSGWTLADIKNLTRRERYNWLIRATRKT